MSKPGKSGNKHPKDNNQDVSTFFLFKYIIGIHKNTSMYRQREIDRNTCMHREKEIEEKENILLFIYF